MRTPYKNLIFELLLKHPLGIDNFKFVDSDPFAVVYTPHGGRFKYSFAHAGDSFDSFRPTAVNYQPGFESWYRTADFISFHETLWDFDRWLNDEVMAFNNDQATPDLWSEYMKRSNKMVMTSDDYSSTDNFTVLEAETIKLGLNELKYIIAERFEVTAQQLGLMSNRIDYLTAAVDRTNKTDFKGILINTIISIMIALSLDSTTGQELYNLFIQVLQFAPGLGN